MRSLKELYLEVLNQSLPAMAFSLAQRSDAVRASIAEKAQTKLDGQRADIEKRIAVSVDESNIEVVLNPGRFDPFSAIWFSFYKDGDSLQMTDPDGRDSTFRGSESEAIVFARKEITDRALGILASDVSGEALDALEKTVTDNLPDGWSLEEVQGARTGSGYFFFSDGEDEYKIRIGNHASSVFRQKEFGKNDLEIAIPKEPSLEDWARAYGAMHKWLEEKAAGGGIEAKLIGPQGI